MGRLVRLSVVVVLTSLHTSVCTEELAMQCPATGSCEEASTSTHNVLEPPTIDISPLVNTNQHSAGEWDAAAEAVARACEQWGFFQVVLNHGIPQALLDDVVSKGRELFSLPKIEKAKFKRTETNARGWYDDELTKQTRDWKEGFDIGHVPEPDKPPEHPSNVVAEGYNQWPGESVPSFKETIDEFYSSAALVAQRLLEGIASHLGLPRGYFAPSFEPHTSYLRLNYYPQCPEPSTLSVNRHTDAGALTVLLQENGTTALQVNHQGTERWVSIPPVDGAMTINVGDMLQVWTNDLFVAPEHRVLSQKDRDRFSAPFFYNPAYHADIAPLPIERERKADDQATATGGLAGQGKGRYRPVNWGEFRLRRFAGDYSNQGEEVQISHYRLDA
ncbi:unnamed protein product [Ectocarpus sp. 12 AP-2014]